MKKLLLVIGLQIFITPLAQADFSDVPADHPYSEAINWAQENNIVNGFADGTFKPDQKINRAELTKIIIEANFKDAEISGDNCFSDVKDEWFARYVCTAKREGIVKGYEDGSFKPEQNIRFKESAKITALGLDENLKEGREIWYETYIKYLSDRRAIPTSIDFAHSYVNRGEFVEILHRLKNNFIDKPSNISCLACLQNSTFTNFHYKTIGKRIYFNDREIKEADYNTFQVLSNIYSKDAKNVYTYGEIFENVDVNTFGLISPLYGFYAKDKDNVYGRAIKIEDADPTTFEYIGRHNLMGDIYANFAKDKNRVYDNWDPINEADPKTFEILKWPLTKDKNHVFSEGKIIESSYYKKDREGVYYIDQKIEGADISTFFIINDQYSKDKNNCYKEDGIVDMQECDKIRAKNKRECRVTCVHVYYMNNYKK